MSQHPGGKNANGPEEARDPATRLRIEGMKILVLMLVEEAGEAGISVGELKRRLGIKEAVA